MAIIKDPEAYKSAVERNKKIIEWIKEKGFSTFSDSVIAMGKEKPEWFEAVVNSPGTMRKIHDYFNGKRREAKKREARAIARNGEPNTRKAKPVICVDNGMEFSSINKAAEWLDHKRTQDISDCCYGIIESVKGYHFRFK